MHVRKFLTHLLWDGHLAEVTKEFIITLQSKGSKEKTEVFANQIKQTLPSEFRYLDAVTNNVVSAPYSEISDILNQASGKIIFQRTF